MWQNLPPKYVGSGMIILDVPLLKEWKGNNRLRVRINRRILAHVGELLLPHGSQSRSQHQLGVFQDVITTIMCMEIFCNLISKLNPLQSPCTAVLLSYPFVVLYDVSCHI